MSYGMQIFDANGVDLSANAQNCFYLDQFTPTSNGTNYYHLNAGEWLEATLVQGSGSGPSAAFHVTVSGNAVSWACYTAVNYNPILGTIYVIKRGTL